MDIFLRFLILILIFFLQDTAPDVYETEDPVPLSQTAVCPFTRFTYAFAFLSGFL